MTAFILHIGPHKTGTSSIQVYLDQHHDRLLAAGVEFPKLGRTERGFPSHRHFAALFRALPTEPVPPQFLVDITQGISQAEQCILSSEDFYFATSHAAMDRIRQTVGSVARVIAFYRHPAGHLPSLWREGLKNKDFQSFDQFVAYQAKLMQRHDRFSFYRIEEYLNIWKELAPVDVVDFDHSTDIVKDFFNACGMDDLYIPETRGQRQNESSQDIVVACQVMLNQMMHDQGIAAERFQKLKKSLRRPSASDALAPLRDRVIYATTDLSHFLEIFAHHNPAMVGPRMMEPVTVQQPHHCDFGIDEIEKLLE